MPRNIDTPDRPSSGFAWAAFLGYLANFGVLVLLVGLLVGLVLGSRPLERSVAAHRVRAEGDALPRIIFDWPPSKFAASTGEPATWLPKAQRDELTGLARDAFASEENSLSAEPIERLGDSLARSGWFEGKPRLTRERGGAVRISGAWRAPAALVRWGDASESMQLVGWDGVPMPLAAKLGRSAFPVIEGVHVPPPRTSAGAIDYSASWAGESLLAGLELLRTIATEPWFAQTAGIDAGSFSHDRTLQIITTKDSRVVWGGRVNSPSLGEVTTEQKLSHLRQLHKATGFIDAGFKLVYVNNAKLQVDISASAQAMAEGPDPATLLQGADKHTLDPNVPVRSGAH